MDISLDASIRKKLNKTKALAFTKRYTIVFIFSAIFLLSFCVWFIYPLFSGLYISLTNYKMLSPGAAKFNNFRWFNYILNPNYKYNGFSTAKYFESFWRAFGNTMIFAIIMVPIAIIVPLGLAILINSKPIGFKFFRACVYLPSIVPLSASGAIFTMLFAGKNLSGIFSTFLPGFGPDNWLVETMFSFSIGSVKFIVPWAWIPIFLMCFWGGWGGNFIILCAGLQNVSKPLMEASQMDGCNRWGSIRNVVIPAIKPQLVLCLFTTIIGYMGLYGQNYVLTSGGPVFPGLSALPASGQTSTLSYFIQDIAANNVDFRANMYGLAAAASIVVSLIVGCITAIQMYCTRDKKKSKGYTARFNEWKEGRI